MGSLRNSLVMNVELFHCLEAANCHALQRCVENNILINYINFINN
jgi:hypothetical protein